MSSVEKTSDCCEAGFCFFAASADGFVAGLYDFFPATRTFNIGNGDHIFSRNLPFDFLTLSF